MRDSFSGRAMSRAMLVSRLPKLLSHLLGASDGLIDKRSLLNKGIKKRETRRKFDTETRHVIAAQISSKSTSTSTLADEHRKRHEILAILYRKRLAHPDQPAMGLRDLLDLLGMPREQLEFSLWYLKEGGYLLRTDSARHSITLKGEIGRAHV